MPTEIKLPVRKEYSRPYGEWRLYDSTNERIAAVYDESQADAIVSALNERERLRCIECKGSHNPERWECSWCGTANYK